MTTSPLTLILKKFKSELTIAVLFVLTYTPTMIWMCDRWFAHDSYYSHGILVPVVTLYLIWQKREELARFVPRSSRWGLRLITAGLLLHLVSSFFRVYFSSGISMIVVLAGLILHFYGGKIFRKILFPVCFLIFMVPAPLVIITNVSFKMKIFAAQIAEATLNNLRIPAIREGSLIKMRHAYVMVDDVCSGLRSLISLTALGSIFAYWLNADRQKKILLFLLTIPIAVLSNVVRIVFLSVIAEVWGPKYAVGFTHDLSGFLVFVSAFFLLYCVSKVLE